MTKKWYPVINYIECIECGKCVNFCRNNVYKKEKFPTPIVNFPENCINHCHGCGNLCPQGAISYVGDDTGWKPPFGKLNNCSCGGCCS